MRGKLTLTRSVDETLKLAFSKFGLQSQPVTHAHCLALSDLPLVDNNPFDRMLVARARCEKLTLVTADEILRTYPVEILWCGR